MKEKFEIGKYYSFIWNWCDSGRQIVKISEIDKTMIIHTFRYSFKWEENRGSGGIYLSEISDVKEMSIEEVQPYLANDNPDKIKMYAGRWYKIENEHKPFTCINIVKVAKNWFNGMVTGEIGYYNLRNCNNKTEGWEDSHSFLDDIINYSELSLEEVQQYLPDGHKDKQVKTKTMKKQTFQIKGSSELLEAMWKILTGMGYESYYSSLNFNYPICTNLINVKHDTTKEGYKKIMTYINPTTNVTFNLPEQWDECIDFCKKQLALWDEPEISNKFIVGKWYKTVGLTFFGKFHSGEGRERDFVFTASELSTKLNGYRDFNNSPYSFCSGYKWVEATQEEIDKFLPNGHPDKTKIEKWDVGTYVVFLKTYGDCSELGTIDKIIPNPYGGSTMYLENEKICTQDEDYVKWFATLPEAEAFAKTLSVKELPFGDTMWKLNREKQIAESSFGTVGIEDIKKVLDWLNYRPIILNYPLKLRAINSTKKDFRLKFGCQEGTEEELRNIYKFLQA